MTHELKRIMILAGGTGGHVFPGLAVARYLRDRGVVVEWMGTEAGLEAAVVPRNKFVLHAIRIKSVRGGGVARWVLLPFRLGSAVIQSFVILSQHRPQLVLAMGGFASGPGAIAAWIMRIPVLVHEQNAVPGLTNRVLSVVARKVMTGFPGVLAEHPGTRHVGNPVRREIAAMSDPDTRYAQHQGRMRLLIIGGSQGARALNRIVPQAIAAMEPDKRPEIWHQCGARWLDEARKSYHDANITSVELSAFIEDMAEAYSWADLVICRAGAMTVAELAAGGVASLLVPYPYAVDDHQTANAEYLVRNEAAILVQEKELTVERLSRNLAELDANRGVLLNMAKAARTQAVTDAVDTVAGICEEVVHA
ncbi:MAG: undecaprenyldiphospho-muramoylpentapeptide beta-N-acetylglucosaminyltransferase [Gammaproteobacteria bacterium]|nr:undecaprenyldiphospho-muramoylpentapeptide beta-N-acetylglucosaminyltransferase [Gammaproteobacteria bacterium]